jgi:hypothetical protein
MRTRSMTSTTDFEFVMDKIFCTKPDSPLSKSFEKCGVTDVGSIVSLTDTAIDRLKYRDDSSTPTVVESLGIGYQQLIRVFNAWVETRIDEGNPIHGDWQNKATKTDFDEYRLSGFAKYTGTKHVPTPTMAPPGTGSAFAPKPRDLVLEFKKGIKRDPASFTVMKDNKQWDSVHRTLKAQTNYQDVADVLDPSYVPKSAEDIALFDEKQKYMYSVLEKILQTDEGKVIVRSHDLDRDAQKIYAEFLATMTMSTEAIMGSGELLSYLTTAKISDGSWRGTAKAFVLNWIEQLRQYQDTVPLTDRLSETVQRTMLQNAVRNLEALHHVQITSDLQQTTHGTVLTFAQYRSLLINAATGYDKRNTKQHSGGKPGRTAFSSEIIFDDQYALTDDVFYDADAPDTTYDVDTSPIELLAYAMNRRDRPQFKPGSRMPIARWKALSEQAQGIWDTMEDGDKAVILALQENRKTGFKSEHPKTSDHSKFSVNTHLTQDAPVGTVDDVLIAMVTKHSNREKPPSHPADVRAVLSQPVKEPKVQIKDDTLTINGHKYVRQVLSHDIQYSVSQASRRTKGSLIDRGANGGIAGSDTRVIERHAHRTVDIRGIDNHEICSIPIVNAGAIVRSQRGEVVAIFNQYAYHPTQGRSIHSSCQLESFANDVNDRSIHTPGGLQRIKTVDGYVFPLSVRDGLPYLDMRPYTDDEFNTLPHVVFTSDVDWDPRILDFDVEGVNEWYDAISDNVDHSELFDVFGDYKGRTPDLDVSSTDIWFDTVAPDQYLRAQIEEATFICSEHAVRVQNFDHDNFADVFFVNDTKAVDDAVDNVDPVTTPAEAVPPDQAVFDEWYAEVSDDATNTNNAQARTFKVQDPDYEKLRPLFGWMNTKTIKKTFENTTQYARIPHGTILKKHYKSPFPALNVKRRDEPVATDTVFSDTPSIDGGETCAQIFVGTESLVTDIYGMKNEKQFVNTLEDNIRERGAMSRLLSDRAQVEISARVVSILRALHIGQWQSEPHQQHQNPCERRYQTLKTTTNTLLDRSGSPAYTWLLCLIYVGVLLNLTYNWTLGGIPLQVAEGVTQDISPLLRFYWWEPVYFKVDDASFPSDSREERGHFVGISRNVGHAMTYKILCDKSLKVIHRANLRSAANPSDPNLRLDPLDGEKKSTRIVKSAQDENEDSGDQAKPMVYFETGDLVGRTFLMKEDDEGLRDRARIVEVLDDHERNVADNPFLVKFKCLVGEAEFEEILSYNEVMHHIEQDDTDGETFWKYKRISGHEGPQRTPVVER